MVPLFKRKLMLLGMAAAPPRNKLALCALVYPCTLL